MFTTGLRRGSGAGAATGAAPPPPPLPPIIITIIIIIIASITAGSWFARRLIPSVTLVSMLLISASAPLERAVTRAAPPATPTRRARSMAEKWGLVLVMWFLYARRVVGGWMQLSLEHAM